MRTTSLLRCLIVSLVTLVGLTAWSDEWGVHLEPEGIPPVGGGIVDNEMYFAEEPIRLSARVFPIRDEGVLSATWWEDAVIKVTEIPRGQVRLYPVKNHIITNTGDVGTLPRPETKLLRFSQREQDVVEMDLGALPVGDYEAELSVPFGNGVVRHQRRIQVRNGNENPNVRRTWLLKQSRGRTFADAKPYLLELALMMDSDQWGYWQRLGEASIGYASTEESLEFFDRAERAIRERLKKDAASVRASKALQEVVLYRKLLPIVKANTALGFMERDGEFFWVDRRNRKILAKIDPNAPALPEFRPVE